MASPQQNETTFKNGETHQVFIQLSHDRIFDPSARAPSAIKIRVLRAFMVASCRETPGLGPLQDPRKPEPNHLYFTLHTFLRFI